MRAEAFINHILQHVIPRGAVRWSSRPQQMRWRECATIIPYNKRMTVTLARKLAARIRRAIRNDLLARKVHHFCGLPCHTGLGAIILSRKSAGMFFRATLKKDFRSYVLVVDWLTDEVQNCYIIERPRQRRRSKS